MRVVGERALVRHLEQIQAPDPRVVCAGNNAAPLPLLTLVDHALPRYRLFMLNAPVGIPSRDGVSHESPFIGPGMRGQPGLQYYPARLSLVPGLLAEQVPPDIVVVHTAPPRRGMLSLGIEVNILPAAIEAAHRRAALVIAQINPHMPYTRGDAEIPTESVDLAFEVEASLSTAVPSAITDRHAAIGDHVASLVQDGATLQLGIGAIPDATLLAIRGRRGLRVWSEMISDGVLGLEAAGALADGELTATFAIGSQELYDWLGRSGRVRFLRTEHVNDPRVIAAQPAMTSINAALQVDLFDQANASYAHGRIYSGFGGQTDFIVGALHSLGGSAIVALPSWHAGTDSSTVVDRLPTPVTSFQHSSVVTEHGVAKVWGLPQPEQARRLIREAADPRARDQLEQAARRL